MGVTAAMLGVTEEHLQGATGIGDFRESRVVTGYTKRLRTITTEPLVGPWSQRE